MSDMRDWRKAIDEMFSDEFDPGAANRPVDGEYELCPVCHAEDPNCEYCDGEGLLDRTGEHKIPDFSKRQMECKISERNETARIKMKPADLKGLDDDGMVDRPESEKDVKKHLKKVDQRYNVEFVDDFEKYNNPKNTFEDHSGKEPSVEKPYATMKDGPEKYLYKKGRKQKLVGEADPAAQNEKTVSENTMDKEMQELLRLAGMYVKPEVYEQNESGNESPLSNAGASVDRMAKDLKKEKVRKDKKFKNADGAMSLLSESDEQEWIDAVNTALEYIDAEHELAYDVAAENGQMFSNVRHMSWFIDEVAGKILELGMVGTSPESGMEGDDMFSSQPYYDDEDDYDLEEAFGDVEEDMLVKPKEAPAYDDEKEDEGFEGEYGMTEEGDDSVGCVVQLYDNEQVYYALADKFGAEVDFGDSDNQVCVPCTPEECEAYLSGYGFVEGSDYELVDCVGEDLNNGYYNRRKFDGQDFFPTGDASNTSKTHGPEAAKHGNNPMRTRARVAESKNLYETMKQAYRRHRLR